MKKVYLISIIFLCLCLVLAYTMFSKKVAGDVKIDISLQNSSYDFDITYIELNPDTEKYKYINSEAIDTRVSPCSTFKVVNTLIALEERIVTPKFNHIKWKGKEYKYDSWNKDQNMKHAFQHSVVWYYQEIARRIKTNKMQAYLNKIDYGNKDISGGIDQFWLGSSLKISPREQVKLLHSIFEFKEFFNHESIEYLQNIMYIEDVNSFQFYGKTGTSHDPYIGWFIGYYEHENNRKYFATLITSSDKNNQISGLKAKEIAIKIIKHINKIDIS